MRKLLLGILISLLIIGCDNPFIQEKNTDPLDNQAPDTYLFLQINSDTVAVDDTSYTNSDTIVTKDTLITGLDTTSSEQVLHWWGEDGDGEVIGYYYQWDYQAEPVFTTKESDTFFVPIKQRYDNFSFRIWAVDNDSLRDPVPAKLTFPVFNSFPHISFRNKSNPPAPSGNPNVVNYTFPTRTFVWDATDPDGNQTITKILWALDDTTDWNVIERQNGVLPDRLTLTRDELTPNMEHTIYIKAVDVANAESNTIMYPDTTDENVPNHWYVKPAVGNILLVDDFAQDQNTKNTQNYYKDILNNITSEEDSFSVWEIGSTIGEAAINPQNALPYTQTDIEANLNYFNKVIWFAHLGQNHLTDAGLALTKYIKKGGRIFITNGNEQMPDTTWTFTALDSTYRLNPGGRFYPGVTINAHFGDSELNQELTLETGQLIGNRVSALISKKQANVTDIYTCVHPDSSDVNVPWTGTPTVGIHYEPEYIDGESVYFSLPLHYCDGRKNVENLIDYIINEEFED
jgi:hypothetical protein